MASFSQDLCQAAALTKLGLPPLSQGNPENPELIELGKQLFSDARLSADGKVSCSTCHQPGRAFTDGRAHSVGINEATGARNAPSLFNVAFLRSLFWDGRAADLESQALAPLTNPIEHGLPSEDAVAEIVRADPRYRSAFARCFHVQGSGISAALISRALGAYERTLLAGGSAFDKYVYAGERSAMSEEAVRGLALFRGRAQCASCHTIGATSALLTDQDFHMTPLGLPQTVSVNLQSLTKRIVEAAQSGNRRTLEQLIATDTDVAALGRFIVTLNPTDIGKFKTPSLRNVALTAPYMHDGSVATLEDAVDLELYGRGSALSYPIPLTVTEKHDLVAFLRALTGSPEQ